MKKKLVSMLALALAGTMVLAGCGNNSNTNSNTSNSTENNTTQTTDNTSTEVGEVEQVLRWNLGADPKTLDPQLNSAVDGSHIINNTFEGLMRDTADGLTYAVAESHTVSEDGLVYTFTLRDSNWSDGQPVVAGDFEFAWKRAVDPATASEYAFIFESGNIKNATEIINGELDKEELGVVALDDKTLEVTLSTPTGYFLGLTAFPTYSPVRADVVDNEGVWAKDPAKFVCNGPFILSEYVMGDHLTLVKNEQYWNADSVILERIEAAMIVEESTAYSQYNAGQFDMIDSVPSTEIPILSVENPEFYILPQVGTYFYAINMNTELYQDSRITQALSLALNRKQICEQVAQGGQVPATGFVPVGLTDEEGNDFSEKAKEDFDIPVEGDVAKAQALLAEAGYPNGEGFPEIEIMYNTSEGNKAIAEAVQEMWKSNLGINARLTNQEWAVFQDTRNNNAFEHVVRHGWVGDYTDPQTMLEIMESNSSQNSGQYKSEAYDTAMHNAKMSSGQERMNYFYEAHKILMDDMPIIPLYYYVHTMMASDAVEGWYYNPLGKFWFGDAYMVAVEE
jgi:oligopeptide transport system substrate-binding protein